MKRNEKLYTRDARAWHDYIPTLPIADRALCAFVVIVFALWVA